MLEDIQFKKVKDLALAVAPIQEEDGEEVWKVFLINLKDRPIESVFVRSEGYGSVDGKDVKTSSLRHFFELIGPNEYAMLEILPENLTGLNNQFWVSFREDGFLYDKKYVFVSETLIEDNLTKVPVLNKKGVMIK